LVDFLIVSAPLSFVPCHRLFVVKWFRTFLLIS